MSAHSKYPNIAPPDPHQKTPNFKKKTLLTCKLFLLASSCKISNRNNVIFNINILKQILILFFCKKELKNLKKSGKFQFAITSDILNQFSKILHFFNPLTQVYKRAKWHQNLPWCGVNLYFFWIT